MAVLVEVTSVVVRNSCLLAKYPGGLEGYERDCPNATFCTDGRLSRIGFMVPRDAEVFVSQLAAKGLMPYRDGISEDVALVSPPQGLHRPCSWIELGRNDGAAIAWLTGSEPGDLHAPQGWTPQRPPFQWVSAEEAKRRFEFVCARDNVDVYRDRTTGREFYVGRTARTSEADKSKHDDLYKEASGLIKGLILLDGKTPGKLDPASRKRLEDATSLFCQVVEINPGNWAAMWQLGKICQRLADYEQGLQWFSRAHRVNPDNPDVGREASIAAMELGRQEEAIPFCERAIETKPEDPGLRANLALALLFSGKPDEARLAAGDALRRDPADKITGQIAKTIDEVLSGSRPCPHHVLDLE